MIIILAFNSDFKIKVREICVQAKGLCGCLSLQGNHFYLTCKKIQLNQQPNLLYQPPTLPCRLAYVFNTLATSCSLSLSFHPPNHWVSIQSVSQALIMKPSYWDTVLFFTLLVICPFTQDIFLKTLQQTLIVSQNLGTYKNVIENYNQVASANKLC